jgi:hypothetical protein
VTAILPRRSFSPLLGRLLHDRTADKMAGVVSRVPNAAATIIPFDVQNRIRVLQERHAARPLSSLDGAPATLTPVPAPAAPAAPPATGPSDDEPVPCEQLPGAGGYDRPVPPPDATPIGSIHQPGKITVEGRVRAVEIRSVQNHSMPGNSVLACELSDSTGDLTALFYGRTRIAGVMCGSRVRFHGQVGIKDGVPVMVNPAYELIVPPTSGKKGD